MGGVGAPARSEARPSSERSSGRVFQLHRKSKVNGEHGLPKPSVPEVRIGSGGVEGDFNRFRHEERHDDPGMAVLLLPRETLEELNREGWPVAPGDLGENVTTEGIGYAHFAPGTHWKVGEVELEVVKPCDPCDNLYLLPYVGTERGPAFLKTMLHRRGWFARVVRAGRIRAHDAIEPMDPSP